MFYFKRWILSLFFIFALTKCQFFSKKNTQAITAHSITNYYDQSPPSPDFNCSDASFSYRGDELIFKCLYKINNSFNISEQVFIKDLSTNKTQQLTFQSGMIQSPRLVKSDLLVFASTSDRLKEIFRLDKNHDKNENLFEIYTLNLNNSEIERITDNDIYDGLLYPIKNIEPKIVYVRANKDLATNETKFEVIQKNLKNMSEKKIYQTNNPILDLKVNEQNQIIAAEKFNDEVKISILIPDKASVQLGVLPKDSFGFYLQNSLLYYVTKKDNIYKLNAFNPIDKCETFLTEIKLEEKSTLKEVVFSPMNIRTLVLITDNMEALKVKTVNLNFENPPLTCKTMTNIGK